MYFTSHFRDIAVEFMIFIFYIYITANPPIPRGHGPSPQVCLEVQWAGAEDRVDVDVMVKEEVMMQVMVVVEMAEKARLLKFKILNVCTCV